jgi:hypothetical protein
VAHYGFRVSHHDPSDARPPGMTAAPLAVRPRPGLGRVALYYLLMVASTFALVRYAPVVREAVAGGALVGLGGPGAAEVFAPGSPAPVGQAVSNSTWYNAVLASVSMLGALAIMIPVTWVYILTRGRRGYEESVVHTLLILPVAVTGIVMIVKSSVALAFSLAGIVAAVRFRTTLEDTKDAVYVFLAIGVGLASGVQAVGVALALSLVFNAVVLALWKTRFGDATAGPIAADPAFVGDAGALARDVTRPPTEPGTAGLERHIAEERAKGKGSRANALLVVHAEAAEPAQRIVDEVLEELATRWKLAEVAPSSDGFVLSYLARLEGPTVQGALMDRLRPAANGVVRAAELRSLKGLAGAS